MLIRHSGAFGLRIGGKLALTSLLGTFLVTTLVGANWFGAKSVKLEETHANLQRSIHISAAEMRAAAFALRVGVGDARLADAPEDVRASLDYVDASRAALERSQGELLALLAEFAAEHPELPSEEESVAQSKRVVSRYMAAAKEMAALKEEAITLKSKRLPNGFIPSDDGRRLSEVGKMIAAIVNTRANPAAAEMETLANRIVEAAARQVEEQVADAEATASMVTATMLGIGSVTILLLTGSALFVFRSVSRPIRELTVGMGKLAEGDFDVALPGLERKDEIGDIAAAVEAFKVKSADKARADAEAKALSDRRTEMERDERERLALAEEAERERLAAAARVESERRAAEERDAAAARLMEEFDAAVGWKEF